MNPVTYRGLTLVQSDSSETGFMSTTLDERILWGMAMIEKGSNRERHLLLHEVGVVLRLVTFTLGSILGNSLIPILNEVL